MSEGVGAPDPTRPDLVRPSPFTSRCCTIFLLEFYEAKVTQFSSREISKDTALRAVTALKLKVSESQLKSPKKSEKVEKSEEKPKNLEIGSKCEDLPICQICEEGENEDSEENSDEKVEKREIFQCTGECRLGFILKDCSLTDSV